MFHIVPLSLGLLVNIGDYANTLLRIQFIEQHRTYCVCYSNQITIIVENNENRIMCTNKRSIVISSNQSIQPIIKYFMILQYYFNQIF